MTPCSVLPVTAALHGADVAAHLLDALHDVLQPLDAHVVSTVAEADPDLPLVVLLVTGGTEQLVLDAHAERERVVPGEPMLLLTHPDQNSLPAALEALARLQRDGARGRIVMAHADRPDEAEVSVADAVHEVGGLFVLDCIASGTIWVDMQACGVDVLVSAPQKGWSSSPCCAMVMLSKLARERIESTTSTSFACDLRKWLQIMEAYEGGGHAYHATMPTDALTRLRDVMHETRAYGFAKVHAEQQALGDAVRALLERHGFASVAAKGFQAPGVVVSYTEDPGIQSGKKFLGLGLQTAAGVPLQCDEGPDFSTFRIGLFGLEKLHNRDRTVANLQAALAQLAPLPAAAPAQAALQN